MPVPTVPVARLRRSKTALSVWFDQHIHSVVLLPKNDDRCGNLFTCEVGVQSSAPVDIRICQHWQTSQTTIGSRAFVPVVTTSLLTVVRRVLRFKAAVVSAGRTTVRFFRRRSACFLSRDVAEDQHHYAFRSVSTFAVLHREERLDKPMRRGSRRGVTATELPRMDKPGRERLSVAPATNRQTAVQDCSGKASAAAQSCIDVTKCWEPAVVCGGWCSA